MTNHPSSITSRACAGRRYAVRTLSKIARIHGRRAPHVRARHRREHRGVQRCQRNSPPSAAVRESRRGSHRSGPSKTISNAELVYLAATRQGIRDRSLRSVPGGASRSHGAGDPRQLDARAFRRTTSKRSACVPRSAVHSHPARSSPGQWNVAVISHALWVAQFGADSSVLGRLVQMDNTPTQIVRRHARRGSRRFQANVDAWLPLQIDPSSPFYTGQTALGFATTRSRRDRWPRPPLKSRRSCRRCGAVQLFRGVRARWNSRLDARAAWSET